MVIFDTAKVSTNNYIQTMVKNTVYSFIICLAVCMYGLVARTNAQSASHLSKITVKMPQQALAIDSPLELDLRIESNGQLSISDPHFASNLAIKLSNRDGSPMDRIKKIKVDMSKRRKMLLMGNGDTHHFVYSYKLKDLYAIEKGKQYKLEVTFIGDVKYKRVKQAYVPETFTFVFSTK